jgi:hypothetical protein
VSVLSRQGLEPTQSRIEWVPRVPSPGIKRLGREITFPSIVDGQNPWTYTFAPPYVETWGQLYAFYRYYRRSCRWRWTSWPNWSLSDVFIRGICGPRNMQLELGGVGGRNCSQDIGYGTSWKRLFYKVRSKWNDCFNFVLFHGLFNGTETMTWNSGMIDEWLWIGKGNCTETAAV